jgi:hypothetical protein
MPNDLDLTLIDGMVANRTLYAALKEIRATQGKVCPNFETCSHPGCQSSYSSWVIADNALKEYDSKRSALIKIFETFSKSQDKC